MALVSRLGLGRRDPRWVEPELRGLRLRDDGIAVEQQGALAVHVEGPLQWWRQAQRHLDPPARRGARPAAPRRSRRRRGQRATVAA